MSTEVEELETVLEIDFSVSPQADLSEIGIETLGKIVVHVPLPSFGSSNSYIDLCSDLLDASWALEKLAACARTIEIKVGSGYFKPNITAVLRGAQPCIRTALADCSLLFSEEDMDEGQQDQLEAIRDSIAEFEDELHSRATRVPDIIDWYFSNLMIANEEWRSEHAEHYKYQMAKFPERQVGYFRSAHSASLGGDCYASNDSWLLPETVEIDKFFKTLDHKYRLNEFSMGELLVVGGLPIVVTDEVVVHFPMCQYLQSKICAGFAASRDPDNWDIGPFDWVNGSLLRFPEAAQTMPETHLEDRTAGVENSGCLVHPSGTLIILNEGHFRHLLYDTQPLNLPAVKGLHERSAELACRLSTAAGVSRSFNYDWGSLNDEDFEQLCYDLIFLHPKFDAETIRKLGKSRSRDGGRDIEVFEAVRWKREVPRKWIFQCKLIKNGSSLGASRLTDVGDMLDQHGAQGFGVLTSAIIDATLYDKIDRICDRRGISRLYMSVLELERALNRHPNIKSRFFPTVGPELT